MGIVSNGSFWIYDVEEIKAQDPNWPTHEGWGEIMFAGSGQSYQSFVIPDEVRSISVCLIAGGGIGNLSPYTIQYTNQGPRGGGGGQLVYMNDIPVTPGDTYYINSPTYGINRALNYHGQTVGFGTSANIMLADLVALGGLDGSTYVENVGGADGGGGGYSVANAKTIIGISQTALDNADGGGIGGGGGQYGAGGAAGYSGSGGSGTSNSVVANARDGNGGGGASGISAPQYNDGTQIPEEYAMAGGGVFPFGEGASGVRKVGNQRTPIRFSLSQGGPLLPYDPYLENRQYGLTRLTQSGSRPTTNLWPRYIADPRGSGYQTTIDARLNISLEHGFGFGTNGTTNTVQVGKTPSFGGTNILGGFNPHHLWCARIVWPGNARKFPSQHVYYVPNPGSTWSGIYDNLNGYVYSRNNLTTTEYSI